jgi:tetratricopeptide (TPR) repeat protein
MACAPVPLDWAMTQNNLGNALRALGKLSSEPALLAEAVTAIREALKEYTRERVPLDWAIAQNNLGEVLLALGKQSSNPVHIKDAENAYEDALRVFREEKADYYIHLAEQNLERVQKISNNERPQKTSTR